MIRRIILGLALTTAVAAPLMAQPPIEVLQGVPVQAGPGQGQPRSGERVFPRGGGRGIPSLRGLGSSPVPGAAFRQFGRLDAPGFAAPVAPSVPAPIGPPPTPADVSVTASLQSSISAVFNPGGKTARIKLIETDEHGVEGLRTLKPGDLYRDGWRLNAVTASEATLRKGKSLLHVNFSRGWTTRPALIQPAVLVQPVAPAGPSNSLRGLSSVAGRRGQPAPVGRAGAPGLGLSNARVGGSPPAPPGPPIVSTFQGPTGPLSIQLNPDGSRTVTSSVNGRNIVLNVPAGQ